MKNSSIITRVILSCLAISAVALFGSSTVWAQSSGGNFTASVDNTVCTIDTTNNSGVLGGNFVANAEGGSLQAQIKLPNSSPGLLVTPSLVTGMYTNTLAAGTSMASTTAAIVVVVTDTVNGQTVTLTPNNTCVQTTSGLKCGTVYDERFQQLNVTNLNSDQSIQLILSTLAAHSFNFTRGDVAGGIHLIDMHWYFGCDNGTGTLSTAQCISTFGPTTGAAACAGPGTLTVTQVQQFQHSSQIGCTGTACGP